LADESRQAGFSTATARHTLSPESQQTFHQSLKNPFKLARRNLEIEMKGS
jgi:hypothetical protein